MLTKNAKSNKSKDTFRINTLYGKPLPEFERVARAYDIHDPHTLRGRILFDMLAALIQMTMHDSPRNRAMLAKHRAEFAASEQEIKRREIQALKPF